MERAGAGFGTASLRQAVQLCHEGRFSSCFTRDDFLGLSTPLAFIQRQSETGQIEVVVASRGEQIDSEDQESRLLILHDGRRYEGVPGTSQFRVVEFAEHGIPYRLPSLERSEPKPRAMTRSR